MKDELPKKVSQCLYKIPWYHRPKIRRLLLHDSLKRELEAIEQDPQFLLGFKILLGEHIAVVKDLLSPRDHLLLLEQLAIRAEMYYACRDLRANISAMQGKKLIWYLGALGELLERGEV